MICAASAIMVDISDSVASSDNPITNRIRACVYADGCADLAQGQVGHRSVELAQPVHGELLKAQSFLVIMAVADQNGTVIRRAVLLSQIGGQQPDNAI